MAVQIVLADNADLVLLGTQQVLEECAGYEIPGTSRSLEGLLDILEHHTPDIVIVGDDLYGTDILNTVSRVLKSQPETAVMVLGALLEGLLIRDLFAAGMNGYLYRGDDLATHLPVATQVVLLNRPYLSPTANAEYLVAMRTVGRDWELDSEARYVLRMLAQGCHTAQIAQQLSVNPRRIYWVREKLRRRFGALTNEQLISRAAAEGFIFN